MDNISTKFSGTKLRAQAGQGGNHHGGRGPGHREESEKTLLGREVVVKPNTVRGSVSPSKSGPEPPLCPS